MAVLARSLHGASLVVLGDECTWLPVLAELVAVVIKNVGFSPKVLPVVGVDTLCLVMLFVEGTPLCLEIEQIEISIFFHLVDKPSFQLLRGVCERAIVSIFTLIQVLGVLRTILGLVLLRVVH